MPLPPALAARLAKRGLLKESSVEKIPEPPPQTLAEEVIAEDYDDDDAPDAPYDPETHVTTNLDDHLDYSELSSLVHESLACPNRWNAFHVCVAYCEQRYGVKTFKHEPTMERKRVHLLRRYPVPRGCVEVGDPDTGRYYYWNTETDEVSWLPPQHPRAVISLPAERLRELAAKSAKVAQPRGGTENSEGESEDDSTDLDDEEDDIDDEKDFELLEKEVLKRKKQSDEDRGFVKKRKDGKLDPMDPAAYSDIPKGDWSSGLEHRGTAKTGVDVTVAGPLFQQRPYPSPGAVLRMNDGGSGGKKKK